MTEKRSAEALGLWSDIEKRPEPTEVEIRLGEIRPSRFQARGSFGADGILELAKTIRQYGLISPILVFRLEPEGFELIAGERRFRACWALALADLEGANLSGAAELASGLEFWENVISQGLGSEAGEQTIRARVYEGAAEAFEPVALLDNIQREDLSAIDEARAFDRLMISAGWNQTELAGKLGKSKAYISQRLKLLDLVPEARVLIGDGAIPFASAREVSTLPEALQGPIAKTIAQSFAGDDPSSTREVASMIGRARRLFDPETWRPREGKLCSLRARNVLRMIEYYVRYLMSSEPDRAPAILEALGERAGSRPETFAENSNLAYHLLKRITGTEDRGWYELDQWWAPFAKLQGFGCDRCRFAQVAGPWAEGSRPADTDRPGRRSRCPRWNGEQVETCLQWFPENAEPGVGIWLHFSEIRAVEWALTRPGDEPQITACGIAAEWVDIGDQYAVTDPALYREALLLAEKHRAEQAAELEAGEQEKAIAPIVEFWRAQEHGSAGPLFLSGGLAHLCRECLHYRAEAEAEVGAPCDFAADPLVYSETWRSGRMFSPITSVLKTAEGRLIPRCQAYQKTNLELEPVSGFEATGGAREVLILALERIVRDRGGASNRNGAIPAPLSWVPYTKKGRVDPDAKALVDWLRASDLSAGEFGRLLTVAIYEARALDRYYGPFDLIDPTSGELGRFSDAARFDDLEAQGGADVDL